MKFHIEKLKLKCDVLRKHVHTCNERLNELNQKNLIEIQHENQIQKYFKTYFLSILILFF